MPLNLARIRRWLAERLRRRAAVESSWELRRHSGAWLDRRVLIPAIQSS